MAATPFQIGRGAVRNAVPSNGLSAQNPLRRADRRASAFLQRGGGPGDNHQMTGIPADPRASERRLNAFPVFMRVEGRVVVIVGDDDEALAKARLLGQSSARLRIVAETPSEALCAWAASNGAELVARPYARDLIGDAALVFAATSNSEESHGAVVCEWGCDLLHHLSIDTLVLLEVCFRLCC